MSAERSPILNLLGRLATRHGFFVVFSAVLLGVFEFLMCAMVSTVNISGALEELFKSFPPIVRSLVENQLPGGLSNRGILAFGWNHPVAIALGTAVAIVLASRAVAGEIESGAIEILLSQPLSRVSYLGTHVGFATSSLILLSVLGAVGTVVGQRSFDLQMFESPLLIKVALNYFVLQAAWYGLTLSFSVFGREGGRVATAAFLLALISYLVQALGAVWQKAAFLLPYSLHTYYSPREILVQNTLAVKSLWLLLGVAAAGVGFAAWRFQRRDIP